MRENKVVYGLIGYGGMGRWHTEILSNVSEAVIGGVYGQAAGKDIANPMAAVLSAALLLEHLGLGAEGRAVRKAIDRTLAAGVVTEDLTAPGQRSYRTSAVGDFIAAQI